MPSSRRRTFTNDYKMRIALEAERCSRLGEISALLHRESIHSSQLFAWRAALRRGELSTQAKRRGCKPQTTRTELQQQLLKLDRARRRAESRAEQLEQVLARVVGELHRIGWVTRHGTKALVNDVADLVGLRRACRLLGVSRATHYRMCRHGASSFEP